MSSAATALLKQYVGWPGHPLTREMAYGVVQAAAILLSAIREPR